jgi:phosphorylated CTD-interacting factor 1
MKTSSTPQMDTHHDSLLGLLMRLENIHNSETDEGDNSETITLSEDTPSVSVARNKEVLHLKSVLISLTTGCKKIQTEPAHALCRFLFSSKLPDLERTQVIKDPLLPSTVSYDKSILHELQDTSNKVVYTKDQAENVCRLMCEASREAIQRLHVMKVNPCEVGADVTITRLEIQSRISWLDNHIDIDNNLLRKLQRLYIIKNSSLDKHFNRRLFCILMRYQSLGGSLISMQQSSISKETYDTYRNEFGVTKECMASPLNSNADIFWSAFNDTDCFFGSKGNFFDASDEELLEGGSFMANGPLLEETLDVLQERIHFILKNTKKPTSFMFGFPPWPDSSSYQLLQNSKYCESYFVIQDTNIRDGKRGIHRMSLFILQNEGGKRTWPVTPDNIEKLKMSFTFTK